MKQPSDTWYVRFPDGRVVRAPNTTVVRQHLDSGHIPWNSRVRRSDEEEWTALDWTEEFADLIRPATNPKNAHGGPRRDPVVFSTGERLNLAARLDPARLRVIGMRGLVDELLAALDNTLARPKLIVAGLIGVLVGTVVAVAGSLNALATSPWSWAVWGGAALLILLIGAVGAVWLTQMTYIELCLLRPVRWAEARTGTAGFAFRLFVALVSTAGAAAAGICLLRWAALEAVAAGSEPERLHDLSAIGTASLSVLTLVGEMLLWPVVAFALLLGPVVVIEECSLVAALRQWWLLVRRHLGRLFLYESTAALVGLAPLSFAVPLALVAANRLDAWKSFDTALGFSLPVLAGLALTPWIAYLAVAHVFIYINLRYEVDSHP